MIARKGMAPLSKRGIPDEMIAAAAAAATFAALLLNFLRFHNYPLLTAEVGIVALVFVGFALLFGLLYRIRWLWARAVLEAGLILFAVAVNTQRPLILAAAAAAVIAVNLITRRSLLPFVGTMALIALVLGTFGIGQKEEAVRRSGEMHRTPAAAAAPPAIVHIILDEHIGVEGLPADNPRSPAIRNKIKSFYISHGFRLFGRAYSEQLHTANSIPYILNFGAARSISRSPQEGGRTVTPNAYFDLLQRRGYRLNVYQSEYLDYCRGQNTTFCLTYSSQNFRALAASSLSVADKSELILTKFAPIPLALKYLGRAYRGLRRRGVPLPEADFEMDVRVTPITALKVFDLFIGDLRRAQPGQLYFAHMLFPHFPYGTRPDCSLSDRSQWARRKSTQSVHVRENAYFDQLECGLVKVNAALSAVATSPARGDFVMIVHGDHGSRIVDLDPKISALGKVSDRDMISSFSTLFAVRAPRIPAGYDARPLAVSDLLADLARSDFESIGREPRPSPSAIFPDNQWIPRKRVPLPEAWLAGTKRSQTAS